MDDDGVDHARGRGDATPSPPPARLPARLSTPVARRGDSIASQFQREILSFGGGGGSATSQPPAHHTSAGQSAAAGDDIAIRTPEPFAGRSDADTEEEEGGASGEHKRDEGDTAAIASPRVTRRSTLSPAQAALLADDSAISRRDTVSPAALKSLLQSISLDDGSPSAAHPRNSRQRAPPESSDSESAQDQVTPNQFLEAMAAAEQTPESARKTRAMKRKEREERTLSPSEALLMTLDDDLAPRRASAEKAKRRSSTSPAARAETTTTSQKKKKKNSSSDGNAGDDDDVNSRDTPSRLLRSQQKTRRSTLEPTDADDFLSALRDELQIPSGSDGRRSSDPPETAAKSKRRQSVPAAAAAGSAVLFDADVSPVTRTKSRRATADPSDMVSIASSGSSQSDEGDSRDDSGQQTRRETLNAEDLHEINSQLRSTAEETEEHETVNVDESSADDTLRDESSSRKRKPQSESESGDASSPSAAGGAKKVRGSPAGSPPRESVVSMASKQASGLARPQKTPTPRKQPGGDGDSDSAARRGKGVERQSLLAKFSSPPAQSARSKTPLRGILSAKKAVVGPLTTPTKSVNFGPPQGAEFNLGSPSTSMTPMPAKDAKRMFPLDKVASPPLFQQEEDEDEETSLNTSLLDEADAIDSDDGEQKEEDTTEMEVAGLSVSTTRSPDKNRRRFSLRGVSPLDNQANARRWRRSSVNAVARSPVSARKLRGIGPGALSSSIPAPSPVSRSVFLSDDAESAPSGRQAYADSSASSDAGEDMEITGDFSSFVQASGILSASAQKAAAAMPTFRFKGRKKDVQDEPAEGDDHTVELGSLGDLVAESAVYEASSASHTSSRLGEDADDSDVPALGSLSDLAREGEEQPSPRGANLSSAAVRRFNSVHYSQMDEQDVTLDPIMEEEEDAANSSAPSMMSIEMSEDESDAEYDERRKSLVVNLSSKFARVGSGSPKARTSSESGGSDGGVTAADLSARIRSPLRQSPRRKSTAAVPPSVALISMEELLATAGLRDNAPALPDDHFSELFAQDSTTDTTVDTVKRAAISTACKEVVKWHIDEISSWSAGLSDVLGSLLSEKAPALFSPDVLDEAGVEAIKALHELETTRVQSGLCQWRTKMESELSEKLQATAGELDKDVRALKQRVSNDAATRQSELGALQELIAREKQMAELLDAIEEQQAVRNEYAATVETLETECAALSLEASVLEDQLRVAENLASEGNLVSVEAAAELERQVLHVEEVSAIQGSLSVWRIGVATSSHLKLSAQFDDVVLRVDLQVDVVLSDMQQAGAGPTSGGGFSTDVASTVTLKRRRRSTYLETENDVVRLVQQKLFDPVQLSRFIRTSNSAQHDQDKHLDRPRRICALLQELERYVALSYRFLRELRALSAQYAVEFIAEEAVLWVEFLNFAPAREAKFVVGFAILDEFPFSNFETSVHVVYGPVRRRRGWMWCCLCV